MKTETVTHSKKATVLERNAPLKKHVAQARLEVRVTADVKQVIEDAASLNGLTVSAYVTGILSRAAREEVERSMLTKLADGDRDIFLSMLDNPQSPNQALRKAAGRYLEEVEEP